MNTAAVIIAANPSRHTERFRPTLQQGGGSMLTETVKAFAVNGAEVYVVTGAKADEVCAELEGMDVTFIHNPLYARQDMLSCAKMGIRAAIEQGCGRVMITPLSIPPVAAGDVERIMAAEGDIIQPLHEGIGGHPVMLSREAAEQLLDYGGEEGLRGWLRQQGERVCRLEMQEKSPLPFHEKIMVKLVGQEAFFGPGPRQLLLAIQTRGSVAAACGAIGISYSKGRGIIRRMEQELGFELVERRQGGAGGGSAGLTVKGEIFLEIFARYERTVQDYAAGIFEDYFRELEEIKQ